MAEAKEAWTEVGAVFGGLGEKLKEHFSTPTSPGAEAAGAGDAGAERAEPEPAAADALKDAFRTLGEALNGAVEAVGAAAKDPAIANDVRHVGQALVNALSATFTDAGDEVRKAFSRGRTSDAGSAHGAPADGAPADGEAHDDATGE